MQYCGNLFPSCPLDKTVQFHKGDSQIHRFSMDAFRYIGGSTTTVYIYCKLFLCHKSSTDRKCHSGCSGNNLNRVKRDINENSAGAKTRSSRSYLLEVGPIVKNDATDSSSQNGTYYFNNYFGTSYETKF